MTETTIYLVVTEQYYGGEQRRVFSTLEDARLYRDEILADTDSKIDVVIQAFISKAGRFISSHFCD